MSRISPLAHAFVAIVFLLLGVSFVASTAVMVNEFRGGTWEVMLFAHSHLFFFFPVFGVLVLAAFYIPAVVFTDFYWRRGNVRYGRTRFLIGATVVVAVSAFFALQLYSKPGRGIWEVAPAVLATDRPAVVPNCLSDGKPCLRQPLLVALEDLREKGRQRSTVAEFARSCSDDILMEEQPAAKAKRYCFPAGERLEAAACCSVQRAFRQHLLETTRDEARRSFTSRIEEVATFFKSFFVIVLVTVGVLLVAWQDRISKVYVERLPAIERGVIVGAVAMLFWPLMDYGYQQTTDVLGGRDNSIFPLRLSLVVAPWAAVLVIYFVRRLETVRYNIAQLITVTISAVAVLRYEQIANYSVRLLGSGADEWYFVGLIVLAVIGFGLVYGPWRMPLPPSRKGRQERSDAPYS
ncbi:MAG TPA: hypothetical protein VFV47_02315 [Hyphomicrobiaceae bacterium]|nr:hypothetical protein [Hyphomicrobiaceae bacterium]